METFFSHNHNAIITHNKRSSNSVVLSNIQSIISFPQLSQKGLPDVGLSYSGFRQASHIVWDGWVSWVTFTGVTSHLAHPSPCLGLFHAVDLSDPDWWPCGMFRFLEFASSWWLIMDSPVSHCSCCSVTQSCPTLCDPTDCGTPGLPVSHHLPKFAQVHVHCRWCHPAISSSSPSALNLSQPWVSCLYQMAKVLELQLQHQSFQWEFRVDFL